jgi:hypothetical protein
MSNLEKDDLGMESHVIVQRLLWTPNTKEMRKEKCCKLLNKLKACQPNKVQIYSNGKIFTGDVAVNHSSSLYLTASLWLTWIHASTSFPFFKVPLKQMVLGVVGSNGQKCPIIVIGVSE